MMMLASVVRHRFMRVALGFVGAALCASPGHAATVADFVMLPPGPVEVGEEVLLDATATAGLDDPGTATFSWTFSESTSRVPREGVAMIHFFMKPGTHTVNLSVIENATVKSVVQKDIVVTGEEPVAGFELWHAPFHARRAQYVYVIVPEGTTANDVTLVVAGDNGHTETLVADGTLTIHPYVDRPTQSVVARKFLLRTGSLPKGNYVLTATLPGSGTGRVLREKFAKPYDGQPAVGIDEHNAIWAHGRRFFPVHVWWGSRSMIADYYGRYANGFHEVESFLPAGQDYLPQDYADYLRTHIDPSGMKVIGFDRWTGKRSQATNTGKLENSNITVLGDYASAVKDSPSMLFHYWDDEPNQKMYRGGFMSAWTNVSHRADPQHPVYFQNYRYVYTPTYLRNRIDLETSYLFSGEYYGGKKHHTHDVIGGVIFSLANYARDIMDNYQIEWIPNYDSDPARGAQDLYAQACDYAHQFNFNLLPVLDVVQTTRLYEPDERGRYGPPTPKQIRMHAWLSVVHGAKGIEWYPYQVTMPCDNFGAMAEFHDQSQALTEALLRPAPDGISISDDANERGNRVDTILRQDDHGLYIIAVRVTELDYLQNPTLEPDTITTRFTVDGTSGNIVYDQRDGERRWESHGSDVETGTFAFTLGKSPVRPKSVIIAARKRLDPVSYVYNHDDGNGHLVAFKAWNQPDAPGVNQAGTINYATGEVQLTLMDAWGGKPKAVAGLDNLRVIYSPVWDERVLEMQGGVFTDTFTREQVRIYRVANSGAAPLLSITRGEPLEFGKVAVGASRSLEVTFKNIGGQALTGNVEADAPFSALGTLAYSLAAQESHTVTIRFTPERAGPVTGTVRWVGIPGREVIATATGVTASSQTTPARPRGLRLR